MLYKLVIFPSSCFAFGFLNCAVPYIVILVPEKDTVSPMLAIRRAHANHDTHACWLSPHVVSYFDSTFLSWVVYCGYTRPRGCLNLWAWYRRDLVFLKRILKQITKKKKRKKKGDREREREREFSSLLLSFSRFYCYLPTRIFLKL